MRRYMGLASGGLVLTLLLAAGCANKQGPVATRAAAQPQSCAALQELDLANVRIDVAEQISPDPIWNFPKNIFTARSGPDAGVHVSFCRVAGIIEDEVGFEVWLPDDWNGRLLGVGNAGFLGALNYPWIGPAVDAGYAGATSDLGHESTGPLDSAWAEERPDRVENFIHRAHHLLAVTAKQIVAAHYDRAAHHAYFNGCSAGGWQGLTEARLYPGDYDGIVAGAPGLNFVRLQTTQGWLVKQAGPGGALSASLLATIVKAEIAQCDADDGLKDGVISAPESCSFDPASLACVPGQKADACLTPAQIRTARLMNGRHKSKGGLDLYPGRAPGTPSSEALRELTMNQSLLAKMKTRYSWSPQTFDPDRDVPPLEKELDKAMAGSDPDLSAFAAQGGKLVLWQGWADPMVSPWGTIDYVTSVQAKLGDKAWNDFARFYVLPGVGHCTGGAGADKMNLLVPLVSWVEQSDPPGDLIAEKAATDTAPGFTRPVCRYPYAPVYDGKGDPLDAASFSCKRVR
jgi:feruloyl esterase